MNVSFHRFRAQRGFTLVEIIVTLSIVALVSTLGFRLVGFERGNKFDGQVQEMLVGLRKVQSNARTVADNKEYGMSFSGNSWTTFSRDPVSGTQATLETRQLGTTALAASVTPAATQVVFERLSGRTKNGASGTLTLSSTNPGRSKTVRFEPTGVMYVQ